jgi:hypothetical protein
MSISRKFVVIDAISPMFGSQYHNAFTVCCITSFFFFHFCWFRKYWYIFPAKSGCFCNIDPLFFQVIYIYIYGELWRAAPVYKWPYSFRDILHTFQITVSVSGYVVLTLFPALVYIYIYIYIIVKFCVLALCNCEFLRHTVRLSQGCIVWNSTCIPQMERFICTFVYFT